MKLAILSFVNLSRNDAFLSVEDETDELQFVAKIAPGSVARQATAKGLKWHVTASDSFEIKATDHNTVYLIGTNGTYLVNTTSAVESDSGASPTDLEFPANIGGGGKPVD